MKKKNEKILFQSINMLYSYIYNDDMYIDGDT